jgi:hypothetical protein
MALNAALRASPSPAPSFAALKKAHQRSLAAAEGGGTSRPHGQTLSMLQEEALVQLVCHLGAMGAPLALSTLVALVSKCFSADVDYAWANRFYKRHSAKLSLYTPKSTAARRKAVTTLEATIEWVDYMLSLPDYLDAKKSRVSNVDECRLCSRENKLLRLLFSRDSSHRNVSLEPALWSA